MSENEYFTPSTKPATKSKNLSKEIRDEFTSIKQGFDLLPQMTGNAGGLVGVNSSEDKLESKTATQVRTAIEVYSTSETYSSSEVDDFLDEKATVASLSNHTSATGTAVHGLGNASIKTVTTGATDVTTGHMLQTGDAGLLLPSTGSPTEITDFTAYYPPGKYRSYGTATGAPVASGTNYEVDVSRGPSGYISFFVKTVTALQANQRLYFGSRITATGAVAWVELFHKSNILGTVSQSAGVPTGAIIERGSNANGTYIKFADGTMFCTHSLSTACTALVDTMYRSSVGIVWTFPVVFADDPVLAFSNTCTNGSVGDTSITPTSSTFYASATRSQTSRIVHAFAIGQWF